MVQQKSDSMIDLGVNCENVSRFVGFDNPLTWGIVRQGRPRREFQGLQWLLQGVVLLRRLPEGGLAISRARMQSDTNHPKRKDLVRRCPTQTDWKIIDGRPLVMSQADADDIFQLAMAQVNQHRAEIARVWKEEGPTRTPLVSFDFTEDPAGVMVIGKRCLDTPPGKIAETGIYVPELKTIVDGRVYFRSLWLETISRTVHDEDAILCVFLPQGDTPKGKWSCIGSHEREGTVFERLVKRVERGLDYGRPGPPVFFEGDKVSS
ncbi:hypothetical protein B0H13DRAFT_472197 [Mycena leptocephala]|nr:hypothetical protein B0H13DRAFT_472197 [Mycena leptocephala]